MTLTSEAALAIEESGMPHRVCCAVARRTAHIGEASSVRMSIYIHIERERTGAEGRQTRHVVPQGRDETHGGGGGFTTPSSGKSSGEVEEKSKNSRPRLHSFPTLSDNMIYAITGSNGFLAAHRTHLAHASAPAHRTRHARVIGDCERPREPRPVDRPCDLTW